MNKQKRSKILLLCMVSIFISGCVTSPAATNVTQVVIDTQPTVVIANTISPPPIPTSTFSVETITPTKSVPTSSPSEIPASTATPSFTPITTLSPEDAQLRISDLIMKNGGCSLPCFLGITPGISNVNNFDFIFAPYSAILSTIDGNDGKAIEFELGQEIKNDFLVDYQTLPNQKMIDRIHVFTQSYRRIDYPYPDEYGNTYEFVYEFGADTYRQLTNYYSLRQILDEYNVPSKILVYAEQYVYDGRPPLPDQQFGILRLQLFYPEKGIIIKYEMPLTKMGTKGQGCPSLAFVSIWLSPPILMALISKSSRNPKGRGTYLILKNHWMK